MVGSFVRFLLFTCCEGSLNSLTDKAFQYRLIITCLKKDKHQQLQIHNNYYIPSYKGKISIVDTLYTVSMLNYCAMIQIRNTKTILYWSINIILTYNY